MESGVGMKRRTGRGHVYVRISRLEVKQEEVEERVAGLSYHWGCLNAIIQPGSLHQITASFMLGFCSRAVTVGTRLYSVGHSTLNPPC